MRRLTSHLLFVFLVNSSAYAQISPFVHFESPPEKNNRILISKVLLGTEWNEFVINHQVGRSNDIWFNIGYSGFSSYKSWTSTAGISKYINNSCRFWAELGFNIESLPELKTIAIDPIAKLGARYQGAKLIVQTQCSLSHSKTNLIHSIWLWELG